MPHCLECGKEIKWFNLWCRKCLGLDKKDKIEGQAIRITKRFYENLGITDYSQFDGLKSDIEDTIRKFAK